MEKRTPIVDQIFGANKAPAEEVLPADFADLIAEVDQLCETAEAKAKPVKDDIGNAVIGKAVVDIRALAKKVEENRTTEGKPILDAQRAINGFFKEMTGKLDTVRKKLEGHADTYARQKAEEARAKAQREAEEARKKAEQERLKAEEAKTAQTAGRAEGRAEAFEAKADNLEAAAAGSAADLTRARVGGVTSSARGVWTATITDYQAAIAPLGAVGPFIKRDALQAALNSMVKVQTDGAEWPGVLFQKQVKAAFR